MAFANHMALDWTKNGGVTSNCYASASLLTAVVNDMGVEHTFQQSWIGMRNQVICWQPLAPLVTLRIF